MTTEEQAKLNRIDKLKAKVTKSQYDTDTWLALLNEAKNINNPATTREIYELFLAVFSTSPRYWTEYAEFEQQQGAFDNVEGIFNRCLRSVVSVKLWCCYLDYIKRTHSPSNVAPASRQQARETISNAYDFVLSNIGLDKNSASIWSDYISFVRSGETATTYDESMKMDKLRRIYQQALLTPITNIEQLWNEYDSFENGLNKITAKKFISERSAGYMTARTALREMTKLLDPIEKLEKNYLAKPATWSDQERSLLEHWKNYIEWEKSNPLQIDDKPTLIARVMYAYRSALLSLRFFPELYIDAADFLIQEGSTEAAVTILRSGVETMPTCLILTFTLAEVLEKEKNEFSEIAVLFDSLIQNLENESVEVNESFNEEREKLLEILKKENTRVFQVQKIPDDSNTQEEPDVDMDGEAREKERERANEMEKEINEKVEVKRKEKLESMKKFISLSYIIYMRVARRHSEKAARGVFGLARKSPNILHNVYIASAHMEYYVSKDVSVASRIYEFSLKAFFPDPDQATPLVLSYLDFLIASNNDTNARAIFERAVTNIPDSKSKMIWDKMCMYEARYGDLSVYESLEKRRKEKFGEDEGSIDRLRFRANKFSFQDLTMIADRELGVPPLIQHGISYTFPPSTPNSRVDAKSNHDKKPAALPRIQNRAQNQNLEPVHPERYLAPDFTKWSVFRADAAPKNEGRFVVKKRTDEISPVSAHASSSMINPTSAIPVDPAEMVHPQVALLFGKLPHFSLYAGPGIHVEALVELIKNLPVPPAATNTIKIQLPPIFPNPPSPARNQHVPQDRRKPYDRERRDRSRDRSYDRRDGGKRSYSGRDSRDGGRSSKRYRD